MITYSRIGDMGRLGNQLFQIAATIGSAEENHDVAKFNMWNYSKFFKIHIDQTLNIKDINVRYQEKDFHFHRIPYVKDMDIIGYFQSEKYFLNCKDKIKEYFEFVDDFIDFNKYKNKCSIHIRRTDYLQKSEYHPILEQSYYIDSMNYIKNIGVNEFVIFSDDIEWCKNNFSEYDNIIYSEGNTDIEDLALMSSCSHNIIANSSFSWWGAWLNKNKNKKVIAPIKWFGPAKRNVVTDDLYCSDWIKK